MSKQYIAYNSFSNALAVLSKEEYDEIRKFEEDNSFDLNDNLVSDLLEGNFLINDETNELELVRERMLQCRYSTSTLGLTIAPTLNCNFRCIYCYEKGCDTKEMMSDAIQASILDYVEHCASTINRLDVSWYGGEPLLAIHIIEKLTWSFREICKKYNVQYSASIVTNGYLLDSQMIKRLVACEISHCQITIDGTREEHNARRPHVTGVDTYDMLLQNASEASHYFQVGVRVNLDKENREAIFAVKEALGKDDSSDIIIYPAPIKSNNGCYSQDTCFKSSDFLEFECQYYSSLDNLAETMIKYPRKQGNACCADSFNTYVISANGDMYKCWSDIGRRDFCIGNIKEKKIDKTSTLMH